MYFLSDADNILEEAGSPEHGDMNDPNHSLLEPPPQELLATDRGATGTTRRIATHHEEAAVITSATGTLRDHVIVSPNCSGVGVTTRSGCTTSTITRLGHGATITTRRGRGEGLTSQARDADNASTTVRNRGTSKGATPGRARGVNKLATVASLFSKVSVQA